MGQELLDSVGSSIRVMWRMESCFTAPSSGLEVCEGIPTKMRLPKTHANSGCGTSCVVPSERQMRKGRNGLAPRRSRMCCAVNRPHTEVAVNSCQGRAPCEKRVGAHGSGESACTYAASTGIGDLVSRRD